MLVKNCTTHIRSTLIKHKNVNIFISKVLFKTVNLLNTLVKVVQKSIFIKCHYGFFCRYPSFACWVSILYHLFCYSFLLLIDLERTLVICWSVIKFTRFIFPLVGTFIAIPYQCTFFPFKKRNTVKDNLHY